MSAYYATSVLAAIPAFSFTYGGVPVTPARAGWVETRDGDAITYTDPATGLAVCCTATHFPAFSAVAWVLTFRNGGSTDTPLLEDILPLDLALPVPAGTVTLHHAHGSTCTATDFLPVAEDLPVGATLSLAPNEGRSSDGALPFFNLVWPGGGLVGAIGWSGQWTLAVARDGETVTLRAGQQTTRLLLHPGEEIRTPRLLLVAWDGDDPLVGHNLLRRVLLAHYLPRQDGNLRLPPLAQMTWFTHNTGNDVTEANQLAVMPAMAEAGLEAFWMDAGWFEGGWPQGVGSWVPKAEAFPRGLAPLGAEAHRLGLQFVLWFEPERVFPGSRIDREHPEWVLHASREESAWAQHFDCGNLFNLGDPAARAWLTDHLSQCITAWGIDIYRHDFNIDPLRFWKAADAPDRQGMTEIRYIEGFYALWDELRARHPHLAIDNCASGGRRIDLETLTRSYPLWRSDTQCCKEAMTTWDQVQTAGLSLYVPLHAAGLWGFDPYTVRSMATTGFSICPDMVQDGVPPARVREILAEVRALRPFYEGDFYPLLPITLDNGHWSGWQLHRPDLDAGFAVVFRRAQSPYSHADIALHGLDAATVYTLTCADTGAVTTATGAELARAFAVEIPDKPGCRLYRYQAATS